MHEKNKYRHIPWNRYNLEKYRDINFWSYRPALTEISLKILLCFKDRWKSSGFEMTWWWVKEVYSTCVLSALSTGVCGQMNFVRRPGLLAAPNRFLPRPRPRPFGLEEKNISQILQWTHCQEYNHEHRRNPSNLWMRFSLSSCMFKCCWSCSELMNRLLHS